VEIGAHTLTHPCLATQPRDVQEAEIEGARSSLHDLLGSAPESFSYPYGGLDAVGADTVEAVRGAGYRRACLSVAGPVRLGEDHLRLRREVVLDWDEKAFAARLEAWLAR
jgi:peptidoglycan/xylan/chitin deacetylase (PgdA/CDA1 family)